MKVKFEGIDSFNRPIFKDVTSSNRFGSVDILFDYGATKEEVLKKVIEKDLLYFGNSFDCEPMGDPCINEMKIVK